MVDSHAGRAPRARANVGTMSDLRDLLVLTAELAADFHETLGERPVGPPAAADELRAPRVRVVVGAQRHGTIDRALRLLGLGAPTDVVPADDQGRLRADELRLGDEPTIVCAQAGEVNTGAFDPLDAIADACAAAPNAW